MKGIVVLDEIPKDCSKCLFNKGLNVCEIMKYTQKEKYVSTYTTDKQVLEETKPDWCPIREIPTTLEEIKSPHSMGDFHRKGFSRGWNSCIDAIIGEK